MNFIDFTTPEFYENPYPFYADLREEAPFVSMMPNTWVTGRYEVGEVIYRDPRVGRWHEEFVRLRYGEDRMNDPVFQTLYQSVLMLNPPEHTRLRSLLMKAFNSSHSQEFMNLSTSIANSLIDRFIDNNFVDLISEYALPLPVMVISRLLGLDESDIGPCGEKLSTLAEAFARCFEASGMSVLELDEANVANLKLRNFFQIEFEKRRRNPRDDLISRFIAVREGGEGMTDEEIFSNIIFLFVAGHETTANMIGNSLVALHRHPDQLDLLQRNPGLISKCVTECLRYDGSVQFGFRDVLEDFEMDGCQFRRGDTIFICSGASNRDPKRFDEPDRFNINRADVDLRKLQNFGSGAHYCLGAILSVIELEAAIGTLVRRIPNLRLADPDRIEWRSSNTLRGVEALPATWA